MAIYQVYLINNHVRNNISVDIIFSVDGGFLGKEEVFETKAEVYAEVENHHSSCLERLISIQSLARSLWSHSFLAWWKGQGRMQQSYLLVTEEDIHKHTFLAWKHWKEPWLIDLTHQKHSTYVLLYCGIFPFPKNSAPFGWYSTLAESQGWKFL